MFRITIILLALLSAFVWFFYNYQLQKIDEQSLTVLYGTKFNQKIPKKNTESEIDLKQRSVKELFVDIALIKSIPKGYSKPESNWQTEEKKIYRSLLLKGTYDLIVIPFQVNNNALDLPSRSLMTAILSNELSKNSDLKIPDPYLVSRALGDGQRQYDMEEVMKFAKKLGVKKIIYGYVGHNRKYKMNLSVASIDIKLNLSEKPKINTFNDIDFTDENPPIEVYQTLMPEILHSLNFNNSSASKLGFDKSKIILDLPDNPAELFSLPYNPVNEAYVLQLFAYLTPSSSERTKEKFIEKSLIALTGISPTNPDYKSIKVRAYMGLGLRTAALNILKTPKTIEEKSLFHALNGNLPELELIASQMQSGIKKLITELEINRIAANYGVIEKNDSLRKASSFKFSGEIWPFLLNRAFTDWNLWTQHENIYLKVLLDQEFPISNYTAEGIINGSATLGELSEYQTVVDLSVINHLKKMYENEPEKWCCLSQVSSINIRDYLNLIEAIANDNLMRRIRFLNDIQGRPDKALNYLDNIVNTYDGYPLFSLLRSKARYSKSREMYGADKEGILKAAYKDAYDAMYWTQGQSLVSSEAFNQIAEIGRNDFGNTGNLYVSDYPFRPYYPNWEGGDAKRGLSNAEAALKNSTTFFYPARYIDWEYSSQNSKANDESWLIPLEERFNGNPEKALFFADKNYKKGNNKQAEKYYREGIKYNPSYWTTYYKLGEILFEDGKVEEAFEIFLSYPGFEEGFEGNRVGVANNAYEAGSLFYWCGYFKEAIELYRISANLNTGSDSSITSDIRIKLTEQDIQGALLGSLKRAKRYNSPYGYRDYLGMLHAIGLSKEAWDAFDILVGQQNAPQIWETALVGHRLSGLNESEIAEWSNQYSQFTSKYGESFAAKYLLRAGVTDRVPTENLPTLLSKIDHPVWKTHDIFNHVVRESSDKNFQYVFGPNAENLGNTLPLGIFSNIKKTQIKSDLMYFADAYLALNMRNFDHAFNLLNEASKVYDMKNINLGYMLPYFAFASFKAGESSVVENLINTFDHKQQRFDYFLAKAVISGLKLEKNKSVKYLNKALHRRPHTEGRPLMTEYQYAEICELLYMETKDKIYKELLLDWIKKAQQFEPWFSWSYAMEAKYSDNRDRREKAISMAYYLDPDSKHLKSISKTVIDSAVKKYSQYNLFKNEKKLDKPKTAFIFPNENYLNKIFTIEASYGSK